MSLIGIKQPVVVPGSIFTLRPRQGVGDPPPKPAPELLSQKYFSSINSSFRSIVVARTRGEVIIVLVNRKFFWDAGNIAVEAFVKPLKIDGESRDDFLLYACIGLDRLFGFQIGISENLIELIKIGASEILSGSGFENCFRDDCISDVSTRCYSGSFVFPAEPVQTAASGDLQWLPGTITPLQVKSAIGKDAV